VRLTQLTVIAAAAGVIATPLAIAAPASATAAGSGSAFGIAATGLVTIPPTPAVSSEAEQPARKRLAGLPSNPLASASVLSVSAWAGHGRASVTDLRLAKAGLSAKLVFAKCENGNGISHLGKATLAGKKLKVSPKPNTGLTVPIQGVGTASVILNKQVQGPGGGITVTAIELTLHLAAGKTQTVSIASVTCGPAKSETPPPGDPGTPSPTPTTSTPPGEAPAPTPVPGDLPVTG
jgi:hypothetical protein